MSDIVELMRTGRVCDDKCRVMEAKSGCLCAEAADEIERLRAALESIKDMTDYGTETATWRMTNVIHNVNVIARAALEAAHEHQ